MKQIDRIEQLEALVEDNDRQIQQLRVELAQMQNVMGERQQLELTSRQETQRQEDIAFGHVVMDVLKSQRKHPFVKDRDVYTTKHLHTIIHMTVSPEYHSFECEDIFKVSKHHEMYTKLNVELRTMCKRLVNSGLFITMMGQRYIPVNPHDEYSKPSTARGTLIIPKSARNCKKYEKMSASAIGNIGKRQEERAAKLNREMLAGLKEQRRKEEEFLSSMDSGKIIDVADKAKVDTEVSFL